MNNFEELLENIKNGREVEFEYKNQKYSITNYCDGTWSLYNDSTNVEILRFKTSSDNELSELGRTIISGHSLNEIINDSIVGARILYIL